MKTRSLKLWLAAAATIPLLTIAAVAQSVSTSLAGLPEADVIIYVNPQRLLNEAAPRVMTAKDFTEMRATFADMKKSVGFDPSSVEYLVLALRFHKPAGDLSFVAPDVLVVAGGDFSAESLLSLAELTLQDKVRLEKHGTKSIALMKVDPIAAQVEKYPLLQSLSEIGAVSLSGNSLAIGNLSYLKSAIDASEGTGRVNPATLASLLRDPNVLMAATGTPLTSFAKAFGLFGTATAPRDNGCQSQFGNFYMALTLSEKSFNVRGAMNADNPDTAKILVSLMSGLLQQGLSATPENEPAGATEAIKALGDVSQETYTIFKSLKLSPQGNEVVWQADIADRLIADIYAPKKPEKPATPKTPPPRRPVRKKRTNRM